MKMILRCAAAGGVLLLGGCGGSDLSRTFGLTRDAPDEFTVTTRAPLSMPPDFALRPPQPGVARPQEPSGTQAAETTVAGAAALAPSTSPTLRWPTAAPCAPARSQSRSDRPWASTRP